MQKQVCVDMVKEMLKQAKNNDTFLKCIITIDMTWVFQLYMLTNQQISERKTFNEPRQKNIGKIQSKIKVL